MSDGNPFFERMSAESDAIIDQIRPLLALCVAALQGIVVAELTAIWLAGHQPELREQLMVMQDTAVRELITLWHDRMWAGGS